MTQNEEKEKKIVMDSKVAPSNNAGDENIDDVPIYRKKRLIIPLLLMIIVAAVGGYYWYLNMQDFVSTDDAYIDANRVSISSKILGRITYLGTSEADTVKAGQILVKLDDNDLLANETSAKAELELAQQNVVLAKVSLKGAEDDFSRGESQYKNGLITKEQFDHLKVALESAEAKYKIELTKISTAKSRIGVIESQMKNTVITSPMNGIVAKRWVLTGDIVQPGQPVFTIYELKNIWVTANLEETKLTSIHSGEKVQIEVDSYPDLKFSGRIFEVGNYTSSEFSLIPPNNASGNFTKVTQRVPVKISIDDYESQDGLKPVLRPGMSVEVSVKVK